MNKNDFKMQLLAYVLSLFDILKRNIGKIICSALYCGLFAIGVLVTRFGANAMVETTLIWDDIFGIIAIIFGVVSMLFGIYALYCTWFHRYVD